MLTLQLFTDGCWQDAAQLDIHKPSQGRASPASLAYDFNYALQHLNRNDAASCSVTCPVILIGSHHACPWFGFLDDIMPAGASRRYWVNQLGLFGQPASAQDYSLLRQGTIAPVGNLRIKESLPQLPPDSTLRNRRFPAEWIIERDTDFLEYAQQMGAASGGATGAGGEAPKLLLRCSAENEVWIDTWQDDLTCQDAHYLVKYPRGSRSDIDCDILRAEYHFYQELTAMGIETIPVQGMRLEEGSRYPSLWLPRFDISFIDGKKQIAGLESVYALLGKAPGSYLTHFAVINALTRLLSGSRVDVQTLVIEWVKRDMLNIVFGNSDNHGRNSALIKNADDIRLSPVYDFAPMKADPEGIARTIQWGSPFEEGGQYQWQRIAEALEELVPAEQLLSELSSLVGKLRGLRDRLQARGVPASIMKMPGIGFDYLEQRLDTWGL